MKPLKIFRLQYKFWHWYVIIKRLWNLKQVEDPEDELQYKCQQLAEAIRTSNSVVVYTGAGISTVSRAPTSLLFVFFKILIWSTSIFLCTWPQFGCCMILWNGHTYC